MDMYTAQLDTSLYSPTTLIRDTSCSMFTPSTVFPLLHDSHVPRPATRRQVFRIPNRRIEWDTSSKHTH
jgi:hypothetical protein